MAEDYRLILDRDKHEKDVSQHFQKHIDFLNDLIDYGSKLIPQCFKPSMELQDVIVIGVFLKQLVSMLDGVQVLVSKGAVRPAKLEARAAFEASVFIDFILAGQSKNKARYYYLSDIRNQRLWSLRFQSNTSEKAKFMSSFKGLEPYLNLSDLESTEKIARSELTRINAFLSKSPWKEINEEFERKSKRTGREPYWYELCGGKSIRKIAEAVGRLAEYDFYYSLTSEIVHSASYRDHIKVMGKKFVLEPIRYLKDLDVVLRFSTGVAIHTYTKVVTRYRNADLKNFLEKYMEDWRQVFLNVPSVSYTTNIESAEGS